VTTLYEKFFIDQKEFTIQHLALNSGEIINNLMLLEKNDIVKVMSLRIEEGN